MARPSIAREGVGHEHDPAHLRRSRAQWQTLIEQAEHSALSISEFCHAQDLSVLSFYQWRKRLAAEQGCVAGSAAPANPGTFIDLGALGDGADGDIDPWDLELQLGLVQTSALWREVRAALARASALTLTAEPRRRP